MKKEGALGIRNDGESVIQRVKPEESQNHEILRFAQDDETNFPLKKCNVFSLLGRELERGVDFVVDTYSSVNKKLPSPDALRHPLPREGNKVSCAEHTVKNLFSYSPIHLFTFKKAAFTLAEVLITLAIIGVVATMTLPTFINKYKSYVLHKQFIKSYSYSSQTILLMKKDLGIEDLRREYADAATYDPVTGVYTRADDFYKEFDKYVKTVKKVKQYSIKNYTNTADAGFYTRGWDFPRPIYILPDGSSIGRHISNHVIRFWIDSNGPQRGPNRYGFDVFEFGIKDKTDMVRPLKTTKIYSEEELENEKWPAQAGYPCSTKSKQELNGMGCSWYALNNINPDDETKKYWDSLPW